MEEIITEIRKEYERCLKFYSNPENSPELFGVLKKDVGNYWGWRAEGLGFALDRLERFKK